MQYSFCSPSDTREHLPKRVADGVEQKGAVCWRNSSCSAGRSLVFAQGGVVRESDMYGLTTRFRQSVGLGPGMQQAKSPGLAEDDSQPKACAMYLSCTCVCGLLPLIVKSTFMAG